MNRIPSVLSVSYYIVCLPKNRSLLVEGWNLAGAWALATLLPPTANTCGLFAPVELSFRARGVGEGVRGGFSNVDVFPIGLGTCRASMVLEEFYVKHKWGLFAWRWPKMPRYTLLRVSMYCCGVCL